MWKVIVAFIASFVAIPVMASAETITWTPTNIITTQESSAVATTSDGGSGGNGNGYRSACIYNPDGTSYTASNCGSATASRASDMNWTGGANSLGLPVNLPVDNLYLMAMSDDNYSGMAGNCANVSFTTCVNVGYGYMATGTFDIINSSSSVGSSSVILVSGSRNSDTGLIMLAFLVLGILIVSTKNKIN